AKIAGVASPDEEDDVEVAAGESHVLDLGDTPEPVPHVLPRGLLDREHDIGRGVMSQQHGIGAHGVPRDDARVGKTLDPCVGPGTGDVHGVSDRRHGRPRIAPELG
ncbi:hypothetical protein ABE10_02450, partial [Bacillus toyonensis]|nr:hypothetical protein [Bacillus toyonensis]